MRFSIVAKSVLLSQYKVAVGTPLKAKIQEKELKRLKMFQENFDFEETK